MSIRCANAVAARFPCRFNRWRLYALAIASTCFFALVATQAHAAPITWIGGNAAWNSANASWNPADEPDANDEAIFNSPNTVVMANAGDTIAALTLSGGIDLNTNDNDLDIVGLVQLSGGGTNFFIGGANSTVNADDVTIGADATLRMSGGNLSIAKAVGNGSLLINAGGTLSGNGTIVLEDSVGAGVVLLTMSGGTLNVTSTAPADLFNSAAATLTINVVDADARVDFDNVSAIINIQRNDTLAINGLSHAAGDPYSGTLNLFEGATIDMSDNWLMDSGTINVNTANPLAGAGASATIAGASFTMNGGAIDLDAIDSLQFSAPFVAGGGTIANAGRVIFNANSNIGAAADFQMTGGNASITVNAGVTVNIDDANFNADGSDAATNVITVNNGGVLDLDLGAGADESLDGSIVLAGGELDVTTASNEWTVTRSITVNPAATTSRIAGEPVRIVGAELTVGAGATLTFDNAVQFLGTNQGEGAGQLRLNNDVTFDGVTTLDMTGGTVDLDGTDTSGNSIVVLGPLTIDAATMASFGRLNATGGSSTLEINSSFGGGVLTVNLDDPSGEWTLNAPSVMNLANDSAEATLLAGSDVNVNGTVNVIGDVRTTARLDIGSTAQVNINTAGEPLRLAGGNETTDPNTIAGGVVSGVGILGADNGKSLHGFGTINASIDFDGTANLLADDGTLTLAGAIVDVDLIGTADDDAILNVTNPWNTNVAQALTIRGGEVRGATITNNAAGGILGDGLLSARVINNTKIAAGNALHLIVETSGNDNDWDGTTGTGMLIANSGRTLEVRDIGAAFGFGGTVNASDGGRVFANGFALRFNPGSTLSLAGGGKYQSSSSTDLGGTVTVGAGGATIEVQNNSFLTFEPTSVTTLGSNLHLVNNNINIEAGATFSGAGALVIPDGSNLVAENLANIGVLLDMQGALRPGNSEGIGRVNLFDYQQGNTGELFVELRGTALNAFDRLVASGDVALDGYLNLDIDLVSPGVPFVPVLGQTFNIITGNTVTGEFDFADVSGMPAGLAFHIEYLSNAVQLQVVNKPIFSADFDEDGDVDGTDLAIWDGAFDLNQLGDADGDNDTDGADLIIWQRQFGSLPGPPPANAVPEPTSLLLLLFACLTCAIACGRHHGRSRIRLLIVSSIMTFVLPHIAVAQTVNLSLNVEYANPANPPLGGAWTLVAKTDSAFGISSINAILSNINTTGITYQSGIGAFLNSGNPFVGTFGNSIQVVYLQELHTPASVVMNVGRGAGTPGNIAVDFLNDPQWNNSAGIFSGTFGATTPAFTTNGNNPPNVTEANVLRTAVPPFTFALPAAVTTIVRNNLGNVSGDDTWDNSSGSGLWSDAVNWADNTEPTAAGAVTFPAGFPNGDSAITLSAAESAAALTLNDNYTLSAGSLSLPAGATISVAAGKTATITSTLNVGTWTKSGAGTLAVSNVRAVALTVGAGAIAMQPGGGTSVVGSLSIAGGATPTAKLDLNNNAAILNYTGTSPAATVRGQLLAGRGGAGLGAAWNGQGITSSAAATANAANAVSRSVGYAENSALPLGPYTTFRGQPVDDTSILMAFVRTGDANLDGLVGDDDVTIVGASYAPGVPQPHWALGDFDYNGFVDDDDVTLLGAFYDPSAAPLAVSPPAATNQITAVPEPRTIALLVTGLIALMMPQLMRKKSRLGINLVSCRGIIL